jgi:branched-subunit amino acid aminotransferase/4-amino-4-deoxychorismate lyase
MSIVYLNGSYLPIEGATVSVLDRGFIYGDGVYELVPAYNRKPFRFAEHLVRLKNSMDRIRLTNPYSDDEWAAIHERWLNCDIKSISLLGNVLMRQLAADNDAVETVMFRAGFLTEASASNVLMVKHGVVVAPPKDRMILPGITYGASYEFARDGGLAFEIRPIRESEVWDADELWLTSSTKEVVAIVTLDGRVIGNPAHLGKPGPIFRQMHALFQKAKSAL